MVDKIKNFRSGQTIPGVPGCLEYNSQEDFFSSLGSQYAHVLLAVDIYGRIVQANLPKEWQSLYPNFIAKYLAEVFSDDLAKTLHDSLISAKPCLLEYRSSEWRMQGALIPVKILGMVEFALIRAMLFKCTVASKEDEDDEVTTVQTMEPPPQVKPLSDYKPGDSGYYSIVLDDDGHIVSVSPALKSELGLSAPMEKRRISHYASLFNNTNGVYYFQRGDGNGKIAFQCTVVPDMEKIGLIKIKMKKLEEQEGGIEMENNNKQSGPVAGGFNLLRDLITVNQLYFYITDVNGNILMATEFFAKKLNYPAVIGKLSPIKRNEFELLAEIERDGYMNDLGFMQPGEERLYTNFMYEATTPDGDKHLFPFEHHLKAGWDEKTSSKLFYHYLRFLDEDKTTIEQLRETVAEMKQALDESVKAEEATQARLQQLQQSERELRTELEDQTRLFYEQMSSARDSVLSVEKILNAVRQENNGLLEELSRQKDNVEKLRTDNDGLNNQLHQYLEKLEKMATDYESSLKKSESLLAKQEELTAANQVLSGEKEKAIAVQQELLKEKAALLGLNESLGNQLAAKDEELAKAAATGKKSEQFLEQIQKLRGQNAELLIARDNALLEQKRVEEQHRELTDRYDHLKENDQHEHEKMSKRIDELVCSLTDRENDIAHIKHLFEAEIDQLQLLLRQEKEKKEQLQEAVKVERDDLTAQNQSLLAQINQLTAQQSEWEKQVAKYNRLDFFAQTVNLRLHRIRQEYACYRKQIERSLIIDDAKKLNTQLQLNRHVNLVQIQAEELKDLRTQLEKSHEESSKIALRLIEQQAQADRKVAETQQVNDRLREQLGNTESLVQNQLLLEQKIKRLENELAAANDLQSKFDEMRAKYEKLYCSHDGLQLKCNVSLEMLEKIKGEKHLLSRKLSELSEQMEIQLKDSLVLLTGAMKEQLDGLKILQGHLDKIGNVNPELCLVLQADLDRLVAFAKRILMFTDIQLPEPELINPAAWAQEQQRFYAERLPDNLELSVGIGRNLTNIAMSSEQLKLIFDELMANSLAADSGWEGEIHWSVRAKNDGVQFIWRDHGRSCHNIKEMVKPFAKGDGFGSGLGLTIVAYLVEKWKGKLELVSQSQGCEIKIWFPSVAQGEAFKENENNLAVITSSEDEMLAEMLVQNGDAGVDNFFQDLLGGEPRVTKLSAPVETLRSVSDPGDDPNNFPFPLRQPSNGSKAKKILALYPLTGSAWKIMEDSLLDYELSNEKAYDLKFKYDLVLLHWRQTPKRPIGEKVLGWLSEKKVPVLVWSSPDDGVDKWLELFRGRLNIVGVRQDTESIESSIQAIVEAVLRR